MQMTDTNTAVASVEAAVGTTKYNYALGYLRAFIVVFVIAHHTALAYHPYAPPSPASLLAQPRWWLAFPVVDTQRWSGFALLVGFNDVFFMSLMFFLSGLFTWQGLQRKGSARFFRDRLKRLGIPFVVAAAVLAPLAYYPPYLLTPNHAGPAGFWRQWLSLGSWPAGPAWFIWVLLAFDGVAALLFTVAPSWGESLGALTSTASRRPVLFFAALVAISGLSYVPMAVIFTPGAWATFGPFTFQSSRILHYLAYFLIGVGIGSWGVDRGLLAPEERLARRWYLWIVAAVVLFAATSAVFVLSVTTKVQSPAWAIAADSGFVLSCAAISFALLALFLRFVKSRSRLLDSLSANSYGIYLVHYAIVSWLLYALLPASLPAVAKFAVVFLGAVGLSWGTAAVLRRIPAVAKLL
jgi:peptidoglycan/LPS O-acetylase OafA/YrhL